MDRKVGEQRMTVEELKKEVDVLITLLNFDLNTSNAFWDGDNLDTISNLAHQLGVYEECVSQATHHIEQFEKKIKEKT